MDIKPVAGGSKKIGDSMEKKDHSASSAERSFSEIFGKKKEEPDKSGSSQSKSTKEPVKEKEGERRGEKPEEAFSYFPDSKRPKKMPKKFEPPDQKRGPGKLFPDKKSMKDLKLKGSEGPPVDNLKKKLDREVKFQGVPDAVQQSPQTGPQPMDISNVSASKIIPDEILTSIVDQVRVGVNKAGQTEMQFQFNSEFLGGLKLNVSADKNGEINVHFITESDAVKEIIQTKAAELVKALDGKGLDLAQLSVAVGSDASGQGGSQESETEIIDISGIADEGAESTEEPLSPIPPSKPRIGKISSTDYEA